MNRKDMDLDKVLDQSLAAIREQKLAPEEERAIADRVWLQVAAEAEKHAEPDPGRRQIRDCEDFQALIPAHMQGALTDAKTLLFEDHVSECLPCRKALRQARSGRRARPAVSQPSRRSVWNLPAARWVAAAAVLFVVVIGLNFESDWLKIKAGGLITIEAIDGELFHVTDQGSTPVSVGQQIELGKGEELRTAKGSRAMIQLVDDSMVEMKERTDLGVVEQHALWAPGDKDDVLKLGRGSVIIEASDQDSGHLFVDTVDSRTAVTGTVFAVNHGIKGTRVSVIEGAVAVRHTGNENTVLPGQQVTTTAGLGRIPVQDEIAWSQNLEQHLALLEEVTQLGRELDDVLRLDRRYSTRLLEMAPDNTVVYLGIPNVSGSLAEAHEVLQQKIATSPALRGWWEENMVATGGDEKLADAILRIRDFGEYIGDELVVTLQLGADGDVHEPLLLAELVDPAGFRTVLADQLSRIESDSPGATQHVRVFEGSQPRLTELGNATGESRDVLELWLRDDLLFADFTDGGVLRVDNALGQRTGGNGLKQSLAERYADGVEWIVGVDMQQIMGQAADNENEIEVLTGLGLLDMQHLIAEREETDGRTENRIVLNFNRERRGLLSWLDHPAPIGSTDFISPNATLAAAFVMKEPATLVDELFDALGSADDNFEYEMERFQAEHGIDIRNDVAATLGGEFAFALDGPLAPTPSWKMIVEVYDPERLQQTLTWAFDQINQVASENDDDRFGGFRTETSENRGMIFHEIESVDTGFSVHYVFVDGYMLAGPSRALLMQALQTRNQRVNLTSAPGFLDLLPADGEINFSGVVYQNLGNLLGPLARLGNAATSLPEEQQRMVQELAKNSKPSLTVAYGGTDHITFVYTHEGGLVSSGLASFFSFQGLMNVQQLLDHVGANAGDYGHRVEPDPAPVRIVRLMERNTDEQ